MYVFCAMNLNDKTLKIEEFEDLEKAVYHFGDRSPSKSFIFDNNVEEYIFCIENDQGWVADRGSQADGIYNLLYRKEPGIVEHFLNHCYDRAIVHKLLNRTINLEKLLDGV
jgi:hypothetical protein